MSIAGKSALLKVAGKVVVKIEEIGEEDVYCLEVPETGNFFANNTCVSNCADSMRYALFSHFAKKPKSGMTQDDVDTMHNDQYQNWRF